MRFFCEIIYSPLLFVDGKILRYINEITYQTHTVENKMQKVIFILVTLSILSGCSLRYLTQPEVMPDCQYDALSGKECRFDALPVDEQLKGYAQIHTLYSRGSATLPYSHYIGLKGKLTDKIIVKDYPKKPVFFGFGRRCSLFSDCDGWYSDENHNELYLTEKQREARNREAHYVFRKAILANCQIVYISLDSLSPLSPLDPVRVKSAHLSLIASQ